MAGFIYLCPSLQWSYRSSTWHKKYLASRRSGLHIPFVGEPCRMPHGIWLAYRQCPYPGSPMARMRCSLNYSSHHWCWYTHMLDIHHIWCTWYIYINIQYNLYIDHLVHHLFHQLLFQSVRCFITWMVCSTVNLRLPSTFDHPKPSSGAPLHLSSEGHSPAEPRSGAVEQWQSKSTQKSSQDFLKSYCKPSYCWWKKSRTTTWHVKKQLYK